MVINFFLMLLPSGGMCRTSIARVYTAQPPSAIWWDYAGLVPSIANQRSLLITWPKFCADLGDVVARKIRNNNG
jgi:hypothetical protein